MVENKGVDEKVVEEITSEQKDEAVQENIKETCCTEDEKTAENGKKDENDEDDDDGCTEDEKTAENGKKDGNDEDDDDEESSDEELVGSLEKPLIVTTARERKSREIYIGEQKEEKKDELDYSQGKGIKLGDIPIIKYNVDKADTEDLGVLHRMMYRRKGKKHNTRKNIREFCGWPFDKDSKEYNNVRANTVDRLITTALKWTLKLLGLDYDKDNTVMRERLCEFLLKPVQNDKPVPVSKRKSGGGSKKKSGSKKSQKRKSKSTPKSKPKEKKSKEKVSDEEVSDVSEASDGSGSESEEEEEKREEEEEKPKEKAPAKKTPAKKTPAKKTPAKKTSNKKTPVKVAIPAKKAKSVSKKRKPEVSDDSSDDEAPLAKKTKVAPTDAELKKLVSSILDGADLEQITMKSVVQQVYDKYSSFDLTSRKDFIKGTVKTLIS